VTRLVIGQSFESQPEPDPVFLVISRVFSVCLFFNILQVRIAVTAVFFYAIEVLKGATSADPFPAVVAVDATVRLPFHGPTPA